VKNMYIPLSSGRQVPLREVANIGFQEAPAQISRDDTKRRIVVGVNTRGRDTESVVEDIQQVLDEQLALPPGYYITYGGQFENLIQARKRLSVAVPAALILILVLLFLTFRSVKQSLLIFTAVPMSAIGGILALWVRDMPFSISAGVGFIALFGVAVLNGIVLISEFNSLKKEGVVDIHKRILKGTHIRLRPVVMTASVASLGFLPMALSTSAGAEVQQPLATVVIGGLITATLLTLVVIPVLYYYLEYGMRFKPKARFLLLLTIALFVGANQPAQAQRDDSVHVLNLDLAIRVSLKNYPAIRKANLQVQQEAVLEKTAFDFEKTSLFHQREETNGSEIAGVVSYGIQQNFDFPSTYIRRHQYRQEKTDLSLKYKDLSKNDVIAHVTEAYSIWLMTESRLRLIRQQDSIYRNFEAAAKLRFETGATGKLELLAATSQAKKVSVVLAQAVADHEAASENLKSWLGLDTKIISEEEGLYKFINRSLLDSIGLRDNVLLNYYAQNIEVAESALKVERSQFLPGFTLGYSSQTVNDRQGFYMFRVGVNLPLLFFRQQGTLQAARINENIAQTEFEEQKLIMQRRWTSAMAALQKATVSLNFYEVEGLQLADEQIRAAEFGYKAGEVDYIAFIQNLNQALSLREEYLNSLQEYNRAVIELNRLSGTLIKDYQPYTEIKN
jgi:cobalt-zinc-cadmium resistance protein CzcA